MVCTEAFDKGVLFQSVRDLRELGTAPGLADFLHTLVWNIPRNAPEPICPTPVVRLAEILSRNEKTIFEYARKAEELGFIERRVAGNGRREVIRQAGTIVYIAGLDLTPLLERASELRERACIRQQERCAATVMRKEISTLNGQIRRALQNVSEEAQIAAREAWEAFPRRFARLGLLELKSLKKKAAELLSQLLGRATCESSAAAESSTWDTKTPDASGVGARPYDTNQLEIDSCNPRSEDPPPTRIQASQALEKESSQSAASNFGRIENINPDKLVGSLPEKWLFSMKIYGGGPRGFDQTARDIAAEHKVSTVLYGRLVARLGAYGAGVVILLADLSHSAGMIHTSTAGWINGALKNLENGRADFAATYYKLVAVS